MISLKHIKNGCLV